MSGGVPLKAIQAGGPLAGYLPGSLLNELSLERESFVPHGALVGSGGIVFVGDGLAARSTSTRLFADFLEDESCGRCTTCHGGNQRMTEIFRRIQVGGGRREDRPQPRAGGQHAAVLELRARHGQPDDHAQHAALLQRRVRGARPRRPRARRCAASGLSRYRVVDQTDPRLPRAQAICPTGAVVQGAEGYRIEDSACIRCGACEELAPRGIALEAAPRGVAIPLEPAYGSPGQRQR